MDSDLITKIFFPDIHESYSRMKNEELLFVHYCSAESALKILKSQEIWLRSAQVMNDFSEIEYGLRCLDSALKSKAGQEFASLVDSISNNSWNKIYSHFTDRQNDFRFDTYMMCVSEHPPSENDLGRLSMWRAYGGNCGVALVVNTKAFMSQSTALQAISIPVSYVSEQEFCRRFEKNLLTISENINSIKLLSSEQLENIIYHILKYSIISTKHPGFCEEREWRVVYSPSEQHSDHISSEVTSIAGKPQRIYKIRLENIPDKGFHGASIRELIHRIIIGPTEASYTIWDAFVDELSKHGIPMEEACGMVKISNIPLRHRHT